MYRLVHKEQTNTYRVGKRGLLGWAVSGQTAPFFRLIASRFTVCLVLNKRGEP